MGWKENDYVLLLVPDIKQESEVYVKTFGTITMNLDNDYFVVELDGEYKGQWATIPVEDILSLAGKC